MSAAHALLEPSPHEADRGELIGRDPRTVTADEFAAAGIERLVGLKVVRAKCIDCSGGSFAEVRKCTVTSCPLWPLRMGKMPKAWRGMKADVEEEESDADE